MAHIKLGSTKSANNSINYAEKKAVERSGLNCDPNHAKVQFEATRVLWNKNNAIQAHIVIQSFLPNEITKEQANKLGEELAEKIAKGYEIAIYTHADKDHIHNHIIINSVHPETGKKYHCHGWEGISEVRHQSNLISAEYGLTIPFLPEEKRIYGENAKYSDPAPIRYNQSEQEIIKQGKDSWKDEIREAIDREIQKSKDYKDFKINLEKKYGIKTKDSGKHIVFTHPDRSHQHDKGRVRGYKLGESYTKEGIESGIKRQISRNATKDRAIHNVGRTIDNIGHGKAERERQEREAIKRITEERQRFEAGLQRLKQQQRDTTIKPKSRGLSR